MRSWRGCDVVNSSPDSEINGIPVAALGVGMFLALAGTLVLENRWPLAPTYGPLLVFGLSLTGALYSAYLTYLELAVIRAVCPYCVISALLITGILILAVARLFKTLPPEAATAR
ncbi:MAG: vitamin K epoxide reductase family protein [Anaerolineales bacterium]